MTVDDLVAEATADISSLVQRYGVAVNSMKISYDRKKSSSAGIAHVGKDTIDFNFGGNGKDRKHVTLHEYSHILSGDHTHSRIFYRTFFKLVAETKWVTMAYARLREEEYKPRAARIGYAHYRAS